ncbi:uncharacterized protein DUF490 [Chitinophaga skermanii]|uniref:Uncharacterized protein DUF490 n=1 Tax=Chitinophaga skermanii TaxID=331697 RepID=A0A327QPI0_9BACT|nr:translocation/assembly module TamB domain-containing protein [Chitinophaga skermanii]RAJ05253.1 uncharacterized protein DUF490 [Chitinophaga skermanii]
MISILVNIPAVQNFLVKQATNKLSKVLQTKVEIKNVNFRLFNSMQLQGTYIEDRHQDTLLYAGNLQVRITDWFFFVDKPELKFIGLQDATINIIRPKHDSLWNYQFIIDAFATPSSTPQKQQQASISIDLKKIDLRRVKINYVDGWIGQDMYVAAKRIYLDAERLDLKNHDILINDIDLDAPSFIVNTYEATRPKRAKPAEADIPAAIVKAIDTTGKVIPLRWNDAQWKMVVKSLRIKNGLLGVDSYRDSTPPTPGEFDPTHIRFAEINLTLSNSHLVKDSIFSDLQMSTKERSGFEVKKLTCKFKMSPVEMEFSDLDLVTNNSHIGNYYTMQYNDLEDMNEYVDLVTMRANFKNSTIASDDIAFFAPPLSTWKTEIKVNGKVNGPVSNLSGDSLALSGGTATQLKGQVEMRGLPNIYQTFISFDANELVTNGRDVIQFFPTLQHIEPVQLNLLTRIAFQGSFTGFINDFVAYGKFQTNLGNLNSDINFKLSSDVPVYSGNLVTNNFNIGALLGNSNFSTLTMNAKVNGAGFNFQTLKAAVDGDVQAVTIKDYTYQNIKTKGELNRKFFNGSLNVSDPNLDMDFAGTIDFNNDLPIFKFDSEIRNCDLKALHFTGDSITLKAKAYLNFAGNSIDNFDGLARLYDVSVFKNNSRIEFDSLKVSTHLDDNNIKTLEIKGSELDGYVKGNYSFMELPNAFRLFLNKYYPSYFPTAPTTNIPQDFSYAFQFGQVDKLIRAFVPQVDGFNDTRVSGALNTTTGDVQLNAVVPYGKYDVMGVRDLVIKGKGDFNKINVSAAIGQVVHKDSAIFYNPLIVASSSKDTSYVKLDLKAEDTTSLDGFYARLITVKDGVKVNFLNSTFTVNDKQWRMMAGNEIYWSRDFLTVHNLQMSRNDQNITVSTNEFNPDEERFIISVKNVNLADVIPFQLTNTRVEGIANGNININNPLTNLTVDANMTASEFRYANDSLGVVKLSGGYNHSTGLINYKVISENQLANFLAEGIVGIGKDNQLSTTLDLNNASISLLQRFVDPFVSQLTGRASGKVVISGTTAMPSIRTSNLHLDSVGVKVNYLNTYYKIPRLNINADDNLVEFGAFTLLDKYGNKANGNGFISHDHFDKLNFEFDITSNQFLFLNTSAADNDLYYGDVLASAKVYFTGPLNNLQLRVIARPLKNTHMYLPISDSKNIGKYEFIRFKTYGKEEKQERSRKNDVKLNMRLDIAANPDAQIDVIMDQSTGDVISANGTGNLQILVNLDGDFSMFGNYVINQGSYNFTLMNLSSWKFAIEKNSTITWNGDPTEAKINITAKYSLPKVSLYNLTTANTSQEIDNLARRSERVDILLNLSGDLMKPNIAYKIDLPEVGTVSYESSVFAKLREINQDQNQALYQIYGLLVSQQFLPVDANSGGGANIGITGKNSVGQALSAQASAILNNLSSQLFKNSGIGFTVNYSAYNVGNQTDGSFDRNLVSGGINSNLFNNRVRLYVGGDYDWGKVSATASSNRFAGDFRVEYLLTTDGRVRVNAFSKSDYDVYSLNNRTKGGVGISYVRDYNRFIELFTKVRAPRREDSVQQPAQFMSPVPPPPADSMPPAPPAKDSSNGKPPVAKKEEPVNMATGANPRPFIRFKKH